MRLCAHRRRARRHSAKTVRPPGTYSRLTHGPIPVRHTIASIIRIGGQRSVPGRAFMSKRIAAKMASFTLVVAFGAFAQAQPSKAPDGGGAKPDDKAAGGTPAAAAAPSAAAAPAGVRADSPCKHDIELLCGD